jgi:hypothetical protein
MARLLRQPPATVQHARYLTSIYCRDKAHFDYYLKANAGRVRERGHQFGGSGTWEEDSLMYVRQEHY